MKIISRRRILLGLTAMLTLASVGCLLLLGSRVDEIPELFMKRSAALLHMFLSPLAFISFKMSFPPRTNGPATNWLSYRFGPSGSIVLETIAVAFVAWLISAMAMDSEYSRLIDPKPYQTVLYPVIGI